MSARTIRRAAERRAKKLASKTAMKLQNEQPQPTAAEQPTTPPAAVPEPETSAPISEARLAANRENAQKSTGPRTDEGKAKVRFNSVKHGLTGATILFTNPADAQRYNQHCFDYQHLYQPVGPEENSLVQSIIDTRWRLARIPGLEYALIAIGRDKLAQEDPQFVASASPLAVELRIRQAHDKQLRNLQLQENRLVRRREKEMKELRALQAIRKLEEAKVQEEAAKTAQSQPATAVRPQSHPEGEFEFSTTQTIQPTAPVSPAQPATSFENDRETEASAA